ncbi:MAG: 2-amino-4-hydroxy-6-hydroxymethyldihydropteridine diphosphokinase [Nitrospina sp.]|jgi:2-amino-4-hydroxy-6-hydroxymethyldihydropteridine diphosphokinase|nr:2-amino-4-hydroxy-6-hydroxymethyldihydropteridine diphosphokinase [Nitrospina sp.]MBT3414673.1 2-amino-4-hydroxy-6-hydroxymethyldihydropteridine diphosphokinase [Nitrospina sp.]MBT3857270.1 2-amino-4-hydroxy-6-hydroxymethyldihydropteridine diphosphokinase [Nitrospina sp.]MBT4103752.1 2-amino-4-hydroxy-6-hydroxymethyldihydropteridine diphosphokinase [Nitrospina sp.]MBT4389042.1 2-amino-4-hydroxy-6-hydroxymethyldihydropteridine diphosphokinase [Nitrospina sp.]
MQYKAFIGIGSNLGIPAENCEQAIRLLHTPPGIEVIARSSLYESEPVGKIEQDWFVNTAVAIRTSLTPEALLNALFKIEKTLGRERREKWGPRIIDLDILAYEDRVIHTTALTLPHPEMTKRRFVLLPLSEFAGDYMHPVENKTIHTLLQELPESPQVKKVLSTS